MDDQGLKELTEAAYIIPCSSKPSTSVQIEVVSSKRRSSRGDESILEQEQEQEQEDALSSHLSSAFPRIEQCETDDFPSLLRRRGYIQSCNQVEQAIERALDTLYSPVLSDIQDIILSYHEKASHSSAVGSEALCSFQEAFFVPGLGGADQHRSPDQEPGSLADENMFKTLKIGTAVVAGPIPSPPLFFSQLSDILSTSSSSASKVSPQALLISLPSSRCSSLPSALKTINLRFRSAWSSLSSSSDSNADRMQFDDAEEEEDFEEDEIDSGIKKKGKSASAASRNGVEGVKKGKDLDGKDLKTWWNSLPVPRPALVLHLPSLESFDPFPLSDLILSLHALCCENDSQDSLPLTFILGLSTSRRALNSILPWETIDKLEVENAPLPLPEEIWEHFMQQLFLNPSQSLSLQIDFQTIEFIRMKYSEMDADSNDVMRALQLSILHHFTTRPISAFSFPHSSATISQLSNSFKEEYIWSLRKSFLDDIYDEESQTNEVNLSPVLEMLRAIDPDLKLNSTETSSDEGGEEDEVELQGKASKSAFAVVSQILQDSSSIPLFLAMNTNESLSRTRSMKRLSGVLLIRQILLSNSRESALVTGLTASHFKIPSKFQIFIESLKSRSEDKELKKMGVKSIKNWLNTAENVISKSSETSSLTSEDSDWTIKILSDLLDTVSTIAGELRLGLRSGSRSETMSNEAEESEESDSESDEEQDVEDALKNLGGRREKKESVKREAEDRILHWIIDFREEVERGGAELQSKMQELEKLDQVGHASSPTKKMKSTRDPDHVAKQERLRDEIQKSKKKLSKLIRGYLETYLLPERLPFEAMHLTQFSRTLSHTLDSQDRSNLSLALDNPQHVLRDLYSISNTSDQLDEHSTKLLSLLDEAETIGLKPDLVRAYEAYREAGTFINLGDWWEMWKQGTEDADERWKKRRAAEAQAGVEVEEEEEADTTIRANGSRKRSRPSESLSNPETPSKRSRHAQKEVNPSTPTSQDEVVHTPSSSRSQRLQIRALKTGPETREKKSQDDLQARFAISVNHLAMMGLLRKTRRKAEHSMRTNWELPPKIAREKGVPRGR